MSTKAVNILNIELSQLQEKIANKKEVISGFQTEIQKEESLIKEYQDQVNELNEALGKLQ